MNSEFLSFPPPFHPLQEIESSQPDFPFSAWVLSSITVGLASYLAFQWLPARLVRRLSTWLLQWLSARLPEGFST